VSVKDGRKAPFIWASVAALDHLRANWDQGEEDAKVRESVGRSVYYALCELANADHARTDMHQDSGKFKTSRKRICGQAGVSDKPVDRALRELERIGLLRVERGETTGSRPGSISFYTLLEPDETCGLAPHVEPEKGAEKVRTSSGEGPHVDGKGAEPVRTPPSKEKKNSKEVKKHSGGKSRPRVNRKAVTDDEYDLATEIVAAFNAAAGSGVTVDANLVPIVGRIREKSDLTAEDHRGIIAAVFAVPWWSGAAGPQVIYGNAAQFERSIETWRAAPAARLRVVEPAPLPSSPQMRESLPEAERIWAEVSDRIQASVPESTYRLWVEPLSAAGGEGDTLYLTGPEGQRAWTERRYSGLMVEALADVDTPYRRVAFVAEAGPAEAAA
jgi:hypothetical protein